MKKRILFLLLLLLIPFSVKGLTYKLGDTVTQSDGVSSVKIYVTENSSQTMSSDVLKCSKTGDVSCVIKATNGNQLNDDGQIVGTVPFLQTGTDKTEEEIGEVVVTNNTYDEVTSIITVKYGDSSLPNKEVKVSGKEKEL